VIILKINKKISEKIRKNLYINTNMMISDNNLIEIESCRKVLEYNDLYIKLKTPTTVIQIWGKRLCIDDFKSSGLTIRGEIDSIEFIKGVK